VIFQNRIKDIDKLQKEINKYRPLSPHAVKQLKEYYRIGLTYTSNAIEGNSLTEIETKIILEDGITIGGKSIREHQEAIGHGEAYDLVYNLYQSREITEKEIKELHRLFYHRVDEVHAGKYRTEQVINSGSEFEPPSPNKIPALMKKLIKSITSMREKSHPVEFAALLHKDFVEIHPFVDGNGRTARLLMNLALLQDSYVITLIPPVLRGEYISCLELSHIGDNKPFINFISNMLYETQKDYLRLLKSLEDWKKNSEKKNNNNN
jgi:Fic family protein